MNKKLTITVDEEIYEGLHKVIGRKNISRFLSDLARPHVVDTDLEEAYQSMAADCEREKEAGEWIENLVGDGYDNRFRIHSGSHRKSMTAHTTAPISSRV